MTRQGIAENLERVQARIADAAARAGRNPADVCLVAVSKTHGMDAIQAAYAAGVRHFGENRVAEAAGKVAAARERLSGDVMWHMVGHIQSRKAADAAPLFEWVHSIDRPKIARRLDGSLGEIGRTVNGLIEVNLSGEESKYGFDLSRWPEEPSPFEALCKAIDGLRDLAALRLVGVMTMAPYVEDPEVVRPIFRRMRALREALQERYPQEPWPHLSMGMSGDYEVAVEEGATMVRVGTAIFGRREG